MKYKAREGQTLIDIATQFYGSPRFVTLILEDNDALLTRPVRAGDEFEIRDELLRSAPYVIANGDVTVDTLPVEQDIETIVDGGFEGNIPTAIQDGGFEGNVYELIVDGNA